MKFRAAVMLSLSITSSAFGGASALIAPPQTTSTAPLSQQEIVAALTGHSEIAPNRRISDRSSEENRDLVRRFLLSKLEDLKIEAKGEAYTEAKYRGVNIVATLPATVPTEETVVVGAHYDSVPKSPGANDNATGVAMVLSVAEALRDIKQRRYNVLFVFFDQEEDGTIGSLSLAKKLNKANAKVHSVHTIDQMGWDTNNDPAIELESPTEELRALYEEVHCRGGYRFSLLVTDTKGSDHEAFRGFFPAIGLTEEFRNKDTTPHYHKESDAFETVNFDYLKSSTEFFIQVLKALLQTEGVTP